MSLKRSVHLFAAILVLLLLSVMTLNVLVDPYMTFLWIRKDGFNDLKPGLGNHTLHFKAFEVRRSKPEKIILGSSVVDGGFVLPGNSQYDALKAQPYWQNLAARIQNKMGSNEHVMNLGIRDGGLYEAYHFLKFAHERNPNLKRAILGIEFNLVTDAKTVKPLRPLSEVMTKNRMTWRIFFERTLTLGALEDSIRILGDNGNEKLAKLSPIRWFRGRKTGLEKGLKKLALFEDSAIVRPRSASLFDASYPVTAGESISVSRLFYLSNILNIRGGHNNGLKRPEALRDDAFEYIRKIAEYCRDNGIQLDIYISPQHAFGWAALEKEGLREDVRNFQRRLVAITPYWDFSEEIDFSESADEFFIEGEAGGDPLHFTHPVGEMILKTIIQGPENRHAEIGLVNAKNVEAKILAREKALHDWLAKRPYFQELYSHLKPLKSEHVTPTIYSPNVGGKRILRVMGEYYAVDPRDIPLDLLRLVRGEYKGVMHADSVEDLVARLRSSSPQSQ